MLEVVLVDLDRSEECKCKSLQAQLSSSYPLSLMDIARKKYQDSFLNSCCRCCEVDKESEVKKDGCSGRVCSMMDFNKSHNSPIDYPR